MVTFSIAGRWVTVRRPPIVLALAAAVVAALLSSPGFETVAGATSSTSVGGATSSTSVRGATSSSTGVAPQLRRKGRWLVDPEGRVVIVHGLNLVYKRKPYAPPDSRTGFRPADALWLARHGFNGARVGTLWAGLTPDRSGVADPAYLKKWQRVIDLLARQKIWMQLDMHQDQWHETYGGEGVPDWAVHRPAPYNLLPPVTAPFPTGYWLPELSTLFDNFWANKDGLLGDWVAAWKVAVKRWSDQPYLMGYDLLNEPWMGLEWPTCLTSGCLPSYAAELQPAMERATRAIRKLDGRNIVWWEPQQFAGGQAVDTAFTPMRGERQLGFSWHSYCPDVFLESQGIPGGDTENCWGFAKGRQRHALQQSRRMNAVPMMSEWGATDNVRAIHIDADVADQFLMGWTHWAYKFWNDPTTADNSQGLFRDDRKFTSAKKAKVRTLVRTYAQATAGTPLKMSFDTRSGAFRFSYRPDRRITAPTEIFVSPLHYPHGYRVVVQHGRVVSRSKRHLSIRSISGQVVTVRVVRRTP
ncbi:cellulase family glycosylhydrolase [Nocardioides sp.]|uniref:glycoside hydrolase family 5 protein n=1 Tax=Nocardioides sp. TaxID=35761 RepID=UPI0031FEC5D2|nr:endoglycoceramidase [Nocardioides sp.]